MAGPTWNKQVLQNGPRTYLAKYTLLWASGAIDPVTAYLAADPTSTGDMGVTIGGNTLYPGTHLKIWEMRYDLAESIGLEIYWDATSPTDAYILNGQGAGKQDFKHQGGLGIPMSGGAPITGGTGKLYFTTLGVPAADKFISLDLWLKKDIAQ